MIYDVAAIKAIKATKVMVIKMNVRDVTAKQKRLILLCGLCAFLSACATSPGEVNIRDVTTPSLEPGQGNSTVDIKNDTDVLKKEAVPEANKAKVQPVYPEDNRVASPLARKLLAESQQQLASRRPKEAIVTAEKGLRIDRKEPKFYEVLAASYSQLGDKKQAAYFAQQGLRYVKKESAEYRSLQQWIP